MSDKVHAIISIDSKDRHSSSISQEKFKYFLKHPITFHKRSAEKQYYCRIENVRIPVSFYAYASDNNSFSFSESTGGSNVAVSLTAGNYTIDELIAEVETQMDAGGTNDYTLTYDDITQKITIASDGAGGNFSFDASSDLLTTMGFDGTETITGASSVEGTNVAYTNTRRYLKILVDSVNSNNYYNIDGIQRIGVSIPITETRNEFIYYRNDSGYKIKMASIPSVSDMVVKLVYHDNTIADLNGLDWSFDLIFYEYNKNEKSDFRHKHF